MCARERASELELELELELQREKEMSVGLEDRFEFGNAVEGLGVRFEDVH